MRRNGPLARVKERLESVPRFGTIIVMRDQHLDPQWKIIRLEERVEELAARVENCRKFILVARLAVGGGGIVLVAMLVGVIQFDLGLMAAAVASTLGGFVVWGSNSSTARETSKEIVKLESERAALIEYINPRVIYSAAPRV
jgi:hypothetical protein